MARHGKEKPATTGSKSKRSAPTQEETVVRNEGDDEDDFDDEEDEYGEEADDSDFGDFFNVILIVAAVVVAGVSLILGIGGVPSSTPPIPYATPAGMRATDVPPAYSSNAIPFPDGYQPQNVWNLPAQTASTPPPHQPASTSAASTSDEQPPKARKKKTRKKKQSPDAPELAVHNLGENAAAGKVAEEAPATDAGTPVPDPAQMRRESPPPADAMKDESPVKSMKKRRKKVALSTFNTMETSLEDTDTVVIQPVASPGPVEPPPPSLPVAILTCDRPRLLRRVLNELLTQPEARADHIYIFQDGDDPGVEAVVEEFVSRGVNHVTLPEGSFQFLSVGLPGGGKAQLRHGNVPGQETAARIAHNYFN
ncbi:hypothetical protein CYMTET_46228, partial [Cymbomonas tetramitiformis]